MWSKPAKSIWLSPHHNFQLYAVYNILIRVNGWDFNWKILFILIKCFLHIHFDDIIPIQTCIYSDVSKVVIMNILYYHHRIENKIVPIQWVLELWYFHAYLTDANFVFLLKVHNIFMNLKSMIGPRSSFYCTQ